MGFAIALQLCDSVPIAEVLAEPAQELCDFVGFVGGFSVSCADKLDFCVCFGFWDCGCCCDFGYFMVASVLYVACVCDLWLVSAELGWSVNGGLFWALGICQTFYCFWRHDLVLCISCLYNLLFHTVIASNH